MKWSDVREGATSVVQDKTGCHVAVPVHRDLAPILGAIPKRSVFILTNSHGTLPRGCRCATAAIRLCFADREHAEQFQERFGGEIIDPKDRPKWPGSRR